MRTTLNIRAVIFDMDGLMIDSEPFHCKAYDEVLKQWGYGLTIEENNKRYVGIGDVEASIDMIKRLNLPITSKELIDLKDLKYFELINSSINSQPGLIELLKYLKQKNYLLAIASGSSLKVITAIMEKLGIKEYFEVFCSAEEVKHGKPFPDLFLYTANKLKVDPINCLVLEDAISGLKAAKQANMTCYIVPSRETKNSDFGIADKVFNRLDEIIQYL